MNSTINIAGREIGAGRPAYIIAEMSANHGQDLEQARAIIRAAKEAGADAVKLQTYTPDTITLNSDRPEFLIGSGTIWSGRRLYDLYGEAYTPWEWQPELARYANELGLHCFSSPFDETAIDFLETLKVPAYKIASFELVDIGLIRRVASTGKPTILSTGMASREEIGEAVDAYRSAGGTQLALLKCTSSYPSSPTEINLRTIDDLASRYKVPVGLSDHTTGIAVPVAAVAVGACIIEKHLTLSRAHPGPDSAFSLEPYEFKSLVDAVRTAEQALGCVNYAISDKEQASRVFRRSLFAVHDIRAGEALTKNNVRSIRPAAGLPPKHLEQVLSMTARVDIARGTPIAWELIQ
jgi:N-acetylneuraminate synthase